MLDKQPSWVLATYYPCFPGWPLQGLGNHMSHMSIAAAKPLGQTPVSYATTIAYTQTSVICGGADDIIDLEDHFADLRGQEELLLLAYECLKDVLLAHVIGADIIAVNAQVGVLLCYLPCLDLHTNVLSAFVCFLTPAGQLTPDYQLCTSLISFKQPM